MTDVDVPDGPDVHGVNGDARDSQHEEVAAKQQQLPQQQP